MKQIIKYLQADFDTSCKNDNDFITYESKDHKVTMYIQPYVEETWITNDENGKTIEKPVTLPIVNRKAYKAADWVISYQFFNVAIINIDGTVKINYDKKIDVSPLIIIGERTETNINSVTTIIDKIGHEHPGNTAITPDEYYKSINISKEEQISTNRKRKMIIPTRQKNNNQ